MQGSTFYGTDEYAGEMVDGSVTSTGLLVPCYTISNKIVHTYRQYDNIKYEHILLLGI